MQRAAEAGEGGGFLAAFNRLYERFAHWYEKVLEHSLEHKLMVVIGSRRAVRRQPVHLSVAWDRTCSGDRRRDFYDKFQGARRNPRWS